MSHRREPIKSEHGQTPHVLFLENRGAKNSSCLAATSLFREIAFISTSILATYQRPVYLRLQIIVVMISIPSAREVFATTTSARRFASIISRTSVHAQHVTTWPPQSHDNLDRSHLEAKIVLALYSPHSHGLRIRRYPYFPRYTSPFLLPFLGTTNHKNSGRKEQS